MQGVDNGHLPPGEAIIYALVHPTTQEVRYVGVTTSPTLRYAGHCSVREKTRRTETPATKEEWVLWLRGQGLRPAMVTLEHVSLSDAKAAEKRWVDYHKARTTLFNVKPPYSLGAASPCRVEYRDIRVTLTRPGDVGSSCSIHHAGHNGERGFIDFVVTIEGKRREWHIRAEELVQFITRDKPYTTS